MQVVQVMTGILWLLLILWAIIYSLKYLFEIIGSKKYSISKLFKQFSQKMWMTLGIGVCFFGFYMATIWLGSWFLTPETKLDLFFSAYTQPLKFIYLGLIVFAL